MHMVSIDCTHSYPNSLAGVLERIDCATFPALWASRVRDLCGAQRIAAYRIRDGQARLIVAEGAGHGGRPWEPACQQSGDLCRQYAVALAMAQRRDGRDSVRLVRVRTSAVGGRARRREAGPATSICDRLVIIAARQDAVFLVNLLNSHERGPFSDTAIERLAEQVDMLAGLLVKHLLLMGDAPAAQRLSSVNAIEGRLLDAEACSPEWRLTPRERQVCARILYGLTAAGIAVDLGIHEHSVDTYRKRAYFRLGLTTRHELLRRYLSLGSLPGPAVAPPGFAAADGRKERVAVFPGSDCGKRA
ncbi:helix-turn-helix transcriptional regulator [Escherichia coli]|uniref:helix-turn-helix transcriptional regulator n=1 Tax=Escherichia coli TaxID=562 RepID=UPI001F15557F